MRKGQFICDETRVRMQEAKRGHFVSDNTKTKISQSKKGTLPWNKGLNKFTDDRIKKSGIKESLSKKGKPSGRKGIHFFDADTKLFIFQLRKWKNKVFDRDDHTCQSCGKINFKIREKVSHHIIPVKRMPELWFEEENGITMCKGCHCAFHRIFRNDNVGFNELMKFLLHKRPGAIKCA